MGLKLLGDFETNRGPTDELYIRIDSWKVNVTLAEITYTTTSWLNFEVGNMFLRETYDQELKPAIGLVSSKVIYYGSDDYDGKEINIDNLYKVPMSVEKEVNVGIFEDQTIEKEIPYTSFDENGEEITLYRTVAVKEKVKIGSKKEVKNIIDYDILNDLKNFSYNHLIGKLTEVLPNIEIIKAL